ATALFWGALLVGRGIAPTMLRYVAQEKLVIGGLVCAIVGNILLLLPSRAGSGVLLTAGIVAEGIGFSVIYPITVAVLSEFYQEAAPRFSAGVFSMAALGGACLPWLVGFVSSKRGGLRVAFLVPLAASIAMIGIRIPIMLLYNRADSVPPSAKVSDFPSISD
ncbi:MAG: MFS transporter, partial [Blastocatellia bacterium]